MIEKLSKGHKRNKVDVLSEGPICDIDEDIFVIIVIELFLLQDRILFLALFELMPLFIE